MIITGSEILEVFCRKHSDASNVINKWVSDVSLAEWKNHNELKESYPSADYVGNNRYVFNIKGNHYRLVVLVVFFAGTVNIRFAGTHAEYDKIDVKNK